MGHRPGRPAFRLIPRYSGLFRLIPLRIEFFLRLAKVERGGKRAKGGWKGQNRVRWSAFVRESPAKSAFARLFLRGGGGVEQ